MAQVCVVEDGEGAIGSVHSMCHGHLVCAKSTFTKQPNIQIHSITSHHDTVSGNVLDLRPQEPVSCSWYFCHLKEMDSK